MDTIYDMYTDNISGMEEIILFCVMYNKSRYGDIYHIQLTLTTLKCNYNLTYKSFNFSYHF